MKTFVISLLFAFTTALAQDWYVGLGATVAEIPVMVVAGYNDQYFGVRFSVTLVFGSKTPTISRSSNSAQLQQILALSPTIRW